MRAVSVNENRYQKSIKRHWLDRIAKKTVLKFMANIRFGHLTLEDDGEVTSFGQEAEETHLTAHIRIRHPSAYRRIMLNGSIGAGEAYMVGAWESPDLVKVVQLMTLNMELLTSLDKQWNLLTQLSSSLYHKFTTNSVEGSKQNISAHYDLSNDFFGVFLDKNMMYSSAIFPDKDSSLEYASEYKLVHIGQRLQLQPEDHLLEIGTGWGGMAIFAAKHFGCRVTTTTISQEQYRYAKAWVEREGLKDRVTVLLQDYRELSGSYDKLVSIEMIEAVGHKYYAQYFRRCSELLKPNGLMLMQAITMPDQRYQLALKSVDFIQKYIFPGGALPSCSVIAGEVANNTDMVIVGMEEITLHYAETLAKWRERFLLQLDEVKKHGFDDVFIRMWEFYMCYCEGGFRERVIGTSQWLFAKPGCQQLPRLFNA